ncbi:hypothetical protein Tco_1086239, partial [Tanacetum coccineum]
MKPVKALLVHDFYGCPLIHMYLADQVHFDFCFDHDSFFWKVSYPHRGSFDEDGAVPHRAHGALMVGREVGDLASNGHYCMDLFADGNSSIPTGRIPLFSGILFLETLCQKKLRLTEHSHQPF